MMNCIIIEDEIPAQNILKNYLGRLPHIQLIGVFKAGIEANSFLNQHSVDLIFLDINLPDIMGMDFLKTIRNPPAIIITTAYPDYAVSCFEWDTIVDYLVKPFPFDRFLKAVNKCKNREEVMKKEEDDSIADSVFLNVDKTFHKIVLKHILYVESDRNYITVNTKHKKLSYIDSLKNWSVKLSEENFIQVHKSYIVNTNYIDKICGNELCIHDYKIPVGRKYRQELMKQLNII